MEKIIKYFIFIISVAGFSMSLYLIVKQKKVAYVDNVYLFENSKLKTEMYTKFENDKKIRKNILDSLSYELTEIMKWKEMKETDPAFLKAKKMQETYYYKEQKYTDELKELYDDYNLKIWAQINLKVSEYGKLNGFDYLLGANGQGSIMFASEKENITDKVLEFINNKYEGN